MTQNSSERRRWLEIDWIRTVAAALAAVVSAVVLSTLGAAGTLIGAAIGSLVATVGGAMFAQGISTSRDKLTDAQAAALRSVGIAQAEVRRAGRAADTQVQDSHLDHADEQLAEAKQELAAADAAPVGWRERFVRLPWKRLLVLSGALFLIVVLVITGFELLAGRSVSSITGGSDGSGTTLGKVSGRGGSSDGNQDRQPSQSPSPSDDASEQPTESAEPTESVSPSTSPSESASESATPTESASPSESVGATEDATPAADATD